MAEGTELEIWWQDEARIGQKNKLTRRWARRGTRPSAPNEQRTQWAYIFGAICPQKGTAAGLVMPYCDTQAMNAHLAEISAQVEPGHHAVLLLDQAGWRTSQALQTPSNITLLPLPAKAPELNPVENLWQFMRDNHLSNRISATTTTSSTTAAPPGTPLPTNPGASCPSVSETGPMGTDQRRLVLL